MNEKISLLISHKALHMNSDAGSEVTFVTPFLQKRSNTSCNSNTKVKDSLTTGLALPSFWHRHQSPRRGGAWWPNLPFFPPPSPPCFRPCGRHIGIFLFVNISESV